MRDYSKVSQSLWQSRRFTRLSDDGRLVYLYVLTCPHGNSIGCFRLPKGYIQADLGWEGARVDRALAEVSGTTLIELYAPENLVRVDKFLGHNPVTNTRHGAGAAKLVLALPECALKLNVINDLKKQKNKLDKAIVKQLESACEVLGEALPTETDTESSVAEATDAAASPDWKKILFSENLMFLAAHTAKPPAKLRPVLGKWLSALGDDAGLLVSLIREAEGAQVADAIGWVTAAVQNKSGLATPKWKRDKIAAEQDFLNA